MEVVNINEVSIDDSRRNFCDSTEDGWYMLTGDAGTGKTIALLKKAYYYLEKGEYVLFISGKTFTLNHLSLVFGGKKLNDHIYHEYNNQDGKLFLFVFGSRKYNEFFDANPDFKFSHIFIDEAQAFTFEELNFFADRAIKTFNIVVSVEQKRNDEEHDWDNIRKKIEQKYKKFIECKCTEQKRIENPYIIRLANKVKSSFFQTEEMDVLDKLEIDKNSGKMPLTISGYINLNDIQKDLFELLEKLAKKKDDRILIGVICRSKEKEMIFIEEFRQYNREHGLKWDDSLIYSFDKARAEEYGYKYHYKRAIETGGICFYPISYCLGLEFNWVIIVDDKDFWNDNLYIALTRAKQKIYIYTTGRPFWKASERNVLFDEQYCRQAVKADIIESK